VGIGLEGKKDEEALHNNETQPRSAPHVTALEVTHVIVPVPILLCNIFSLF
jgi:hypothetical protein